MQTYRDINVLLVEDDPEGAHLLSVLLREIGIEHLRVATNYEQALQVFQTAGADICILDIDLGKTPKNGIRLAEKIRENDPCVPIVLLTSNHNEACYNKVRQVRPSSFLNKELSRFTLYQTIDMALMNPHRPTHMASPVPKDEPHGAPLVKSDRFFFKVGDVYKAISVKEVSYFYVDQKTTFARVGNRNYPTTVQLKTIEDAFYPAFVRLHKSYLVNIALVESICPRDNTIIIQGETLPIGNTYRKSVLENLPILR